MQEAMDREQSEARWKWGETQVEAGSEETSSSFPVMWFSIARLLEEGVLC